MKINLTNRNAVGSVILGTGTPIAGATGAQGSQGVQGAQGPAGGPQGSQGFQGVQGTQGSQGRQGVQGAPGVQGSSGIQGAQGSQGSQGHQGIQGAQGIPGTFAGIGAQGAQGFQGVQGSQGFQGFQGVQGATGSGAQGVQGAQGLAGSSGTKGDKGDIGTQGDKGEPSSIPGAKGDTGAQGLAGAAGSKGDKGDTGAQGLAGATGSQGVAGADGPQGAAGSKGDKGDTGAQGTAGLDGAQGAAGSKGDKGDSGAQGAKGDDVNSIAAFNQANSAYDQANSAYSQANAAYTKANTANDNANTRVLKAGDTMTGNLNVAATIISQNIVPDLDVTYDLGTPNKRFRDLYLSGTTLFLGNTQVSTTVGDEIAITSLTANSINLAGYNVQTWVNDTTERANLKVQTIGGSLLSVSTSNTSNVVVANVSIREANTTQTGVVRLSDDVNNTSVSLAATANVVNALSEISDQTIEELALLTNDYDVTKSFVYNVVLPTANAAANTVRVSANGGSTLSKQQLNFTNTADVIVSVAAGAGAASGNANVGFALSSTGVAAGTYGNATNVASIVVDSKGRITSVSNVSISPSQEKTNAAYDQANAAFDAANTKLPIAGGTITGDLTVSGNLAVLGDSTVLNVSILKVEDNEIILNSNVTGAPSLDAAITVNRGANANVSLRWNETSDKWEWTDDGIVYTAFADIAGSGPQGATGAQGFQGVQGAQGRQGEQGYQGVQGEQGSQGFQGVQGNQGHQGVQGATGAQGFQGVQGAQGVAGPNTVPIQVDSSSIGERRTLDFRSANTSNLTITGTDDPTNNKVILIFDNPKLGGSGISAYGNTELYISNTPPGSANSNTALWWRANTGKFYIYYNDGTSTQWVSLTPSPVVNTSSNLLFSDANTAASAASANTLNQEKANRSGDTFTGNVSVLQNGTKLNVSSTLIESNARLTVNASEFKVNSITISANTGATAAPAQTVVDVLSTTDYRTVKYLIQIKSGGSYQATEILLLHDGSTTYMTEYATITSGSYLGGFSSDIASGNMRLLFDPVFAVNTLNISRITVPV
jgi:hypothetical protein